MIGRRCVIFFVSLVLCACGNAAERKASYVEMAKALIQNENLSKARIALRNALKIDPKDSQVLSLLNQVSKKEEDWSSSFNQDKEVNELDSAQRKARFQMTSSERETLWEKFQLKLAQEQWSQANDLISHLKNAGASTYRVDLATGLLATNRQWWEQAAQALSRAQHAKINALPPLAALINVHLQRKKPKTAQAYLEKILAHDPNHPFAFGLLGAVLWQLKDKAAAFSAYERQTQVNPTWVEPWIDWASLQWSEGKRTKAINIIKAALTQNENSPILSNSLALFFQAEDQVDLAIRQYEAIMLQNPTDSMAANNLAYLLAEKKGDFQSLDMALSLTKHFETNTENPLLLDTLAWIYHKKGLYREAASMGKKALSGAPDHALINYHYGIMTLERGDRITAKKHLEIAAQESPALEFGKDARRRLTKMKM